MPGLVRPVPVPLSFDHVFPGLALTLLFAAFLPIFPGGDALNTSFGGRSAFESLTLVACGGLAFVYAYLNGLFFRLAASPVFLCVGGLSLWALVSACWSVNPLLAIAKSLELLITALTTSVLDLCLPTEQKQRMTAVTLLAAVILLLLFNLGYWHTLTPFTEVTDVPVAGVTPSRPRLFLGFAHPLTSADLLSLCAIYVLYIRRWPRLLRLTLLVVLSVALWLTDGRVPILAFSLGVLLNLYFFVRRPLHRLLLLLTVGTLILGVHIYLQGDWATIITPLLPAYFGTLNGRTALWSYLLNVLVPAHLLLGVGFYSTRNYLLPYISWAGHAHSSYLELLLGLGVVGSLFGAVFIRLWFRAALRPWNAITFAAGVYLLVHSFSNPVLFLPGFQMAALLLALPSRLPSGLSDR